MKVLRERDFGSPHKVLAISRELYKKLTGQMTDPGRASIDLTRDDSSDVISFKQKSTLGLQVSTRYSPHTRRNCQGCVQCAEVGDLYEQYEAGI